MDQNDDFEAENRDRDGAVREHGRELVRPSTRASVSPRVPASRVAVLVAFSLLAGVGAGWFGHIRQVNAASISADTSPAPIAISGAVVGPCADWRDKICTSSGTQSVACLQAKGATELLTPSTCKAGLAAMPVTLARLKTVSSSCDKLVSKLCTDLPPGSPTCAMGKESRTTFPPERCEEMLRHYEAALAQLMQVEAQNSLATGGGTGVPRQ